MCAVELLKTQRSQLVLALAGGSVEYFESVLDYLLSWDVLTWEDYEKVTIREHGLSRLARELLDILCMKGDQAYKHLTAALEESGKEIESTEFNLLSEEQLTEVSTYLQKHRPAIVRKIHGHIEGILRYLFNSNFISKYEWDEIQLPMYTCSQKARRLLNIIKAKGNEAAQCLLNHVQGLQERSIASHYDETCMKFQKKLKSTISAQSRFLNTYDGAETVCLEDVYIESVLEVVKTIHASSPGQPCKHLVRLADIFNANESFNKDADTVLVSGEAGSGKTTLLQQMLHMWATGKAFHNFSFVFPFTCRQLCCIEKLVTLKTLLFEHCCWPDLDQDQIFQAILNNPQETLLIFDGFDEFKFTFTDDEKHCSPLDPTSIHSILCNLVQGNLLKDAKKVVTSRPTAISAAFRKNIRSEVCVKGFSEGGIELFMKKTHNDLSISQPIINLLNTNSSLRGLCHVPVFCWIVSKCHKELSGCDSPQTVTNMYLLTIRHFLLHSTPAKERIENILCKKVNTIRHLGNLALYGLVNCCYVFSTHQLKEAGVSEDDISSGFLVLSRKLSQDSCMLSRHYEFVHITFQCFFVALNLVMNDRLSSVVVRSLFSHKGKEVRCSLFTSCSQMWLQSVDEAERTTLDMLHLAETSNLQLTANFLAGLFSKCHCQLIVESWNPEKLPQKKQLFKKCLAKAIQKHFKSIPPSVPGEKKSKHAMPEFVWLIKCIYEMQDSHFAKEAVSTLDVEHLKLTYCGIGPSECTALAFVLKYLKNPIGLQLDHNSVGDVGIDQLLPCLNLCQSLYLRDNNISDKGIGKLLDQALHWQNFQKIALFNNRLTDESAQCFANLLKNKQNFISLRLGNNLITSKGAEVLAEGVKENKSLQYLGLWGNSVGDSGARALAEALHNNKTLIWLSLVGNNIGSLGAQALAVMIGTNPVLEELCLEENHIIDEDVLAFADSLKRNSTLKTLNSELWSSCKESCLKISPGDHRHTKLSYNGISKRGVSALLEALENNSSITSIWLRGNSLTSEESEYFANLNDRLLC